MNGIPLSQLQVRSLQTDVDLIPIIRSTGQQHYENYLISASSITDTFTTASFAVSAESATSSSHANLSDTSSYTATSSYSLMSNGSISSSYASISATSILSNTSSYSLLSGTASIAQFALNVVTNPNVVANYAYTASWATQSLSSSYSKTSSISTSASYADRSYSAYTSTVSDWSTRSGTADRATAATQADTASYISNASSFVLFDPPLSQSINGLIPGNWTSVIISTTSVPVNVARAVHISLTYHSWAGTGTHSVRIRKNPSYRFKQMFFSYDDEMTYDFILYIEPSSKSFQIQHQASMMGTYTLIINGYYK